ncbi:hypothetical protein EDD86DRAFT_71972 [Gorgonomyces haynaldii]|nr:hypothetical protein EDD86DRAFT_71972 [Gorgonomyces haynaldii]
MLYVEVFLATFRYFLPAQNILDCLIGWYNAEADEMKRPGSESFLRKYKKAIQQRSVRVLLTWIKNHWVDFQHDQKLHSDLIVFVDFLEKVSFGTNQKLVQAIREQVLRFDFRDCCGTPIATFPCLRTRNHPEIHPSHGHSSGRQMTLHTT